MCKLREINILKETSKGTPQEQHNYFVLVTANKKESLRIVNKFNSVIF